MPKCLITSEITQDFFLTKAYRESSQKLYKSTETA